MPRRQAVDSVRIDSLPPRRENLSALQLQDDPMAKLAGKPRDRLLWTGCLLFALALLLRLLFLLATPDAAGPYSPYYKGDTPVWLEYARAIRESRSFDLGLPLRPPGVAYIVAFTWNGQDSGLLVLRLAWCLLGAGVVALLFIAAARSFGIVVAAIAALIAAASTGLLILSTAPNNEIPYLLLVLASFTLWEPVRRRPGLPVLCAWGVLHGLACLIRVEHVLFFALVSAWLLWAWARPPGGNGAWRSSLARSALTTAFFILPLIPWHLHIWADIERFNTHPLPANEATERAYAQLERILAGLRWTADAEREHEALPAYARRPLGNFVAATVAVRGGTEVTGGDFRIIEEAFGYRPEPIAAFPFVSLYGGLNFRLANHPGASGGFSRAPLEAPPPLSGGRAAYPGFLVAGLPPPDLTFTYPPHVEIVNHGYRLGRDWILGHPGDFLSLALGKLRIFWSGATQGFTGYNLPLGMPGKRRAVDMVVPEGGLGTAAWRSGAFIVLLLGLWAGCRGPALVPWVLLLGTKLIVSLAFFGYAREGAVVIPVLALAAGLFAARTLPRLAGRVSAAGSRRWVWAAGLAALTLVAIEGARWMSEPVVTLDGRETGRADPFPSMEYQERRLRVD